YLGEFAAKLGQAEKASEYRRLAMAMPPDYVFPFQNEAIDVLRQAIAANPRDARAPYYLGNLLFDGQPEEATRLWAVSASLDPSFAIVHRNLATAYAHRKPAPDVAFVDTDPRKFRCLAAVRERIGPDQPGVSLTWSAMFTDVSDDGTLGY